MTTNINFYKLLVIIPQLLRYYYSINTMITVTKSINCIAECVCCNCIDDHIAKSNTKKHTYNKQSENNQLQV